MSSHTSEMAPAPSSARSFIWLKLSLPSVRKNDCSSVIQREVLILHDQIMALAIWKLPHLINAAGPRIPRMSHPQLKGGHLSSIQFYFQMVQSDHQKSFFNQSWPARWSLFYEQIACRPFHFLTLKNREKQSFDGVVYAFRNSIILSVSFFQVVNLHAVC